MIPNQLVPWMTHVEKIKQKHPNKPYKEVLKLAKRSYHGKGIYQSTINTINSLTGSKAEKLNSGNYGLWNSNYTGPGTPLDSYIERGVKPLNKTDRCSMIHDIDYKNAKNNHDIRAADEKVLDCYRKSMKSDPILGSVAYGGIKLKNTFEDLLPSIARKVEGPTYYGGKGVARKLISKSLTSM